ncbi:MAG: hypothetical protein Q7J44_14365 [Pseudotabrizicola sp.]|uniref:hypothetical protein n=1 Tax=Pseudotabrizicola sp. TaxID=2939647 RepID=UPI0027256B0A|nr:hypothetical protein [Pseudotabrizicola sp.]MDO9639721.1 hypothetical protein [Pseudotabrizicola sp.]
MTMRGTIIGLMAITCAGSVQAQDSYNRIDTPSGVAVITRQDIDSVLSIGGQTFVFEGMPYASFGERLGDVVLVSVSSGGSACPAEFVWLDTRPGQLRLSDRFGTCSDLAEVSWDAESVIVTLPSMRPGEGPVAFHWDGKSAAIRDVVLQMPPSGIAATAPPSAWLGRHPSEFLSAPEQRERLVAQMGEAALLDAQRIIGVASNFETVGDWVVASGCQPHACDITEGAIAMYRDWLLVALWEQGKGVRVFGDQTGLMPAAIAKVMARR